MTNQVILDKEKHKNTRILTKHGTEFGDTRHVIGVAPSEFRSLLAYYPILLMKEPEGEQLVPVTLVGFEPGENLFLEGGTWDAPYVPANVRRQPFALQLLPAIGEDGKDTLIPAVTINLDSPRLSEREGERIVDEEGKETEYFQQVQKSLWQLVQGQDAAKTFVSKLESLDLIEPLDFQLNFANGTARSMRGLYTIKEASLRQLDDEATLDLHRTGYLDLIYSMLASLSQIGGLLARKNRKIAAEMESPASEA